MEEKWKKYSLRNTGCGAVLLLCSGALLAGARRVPGFGQWYAVHIYPLWVNFFGRFFGMFPFSVVEFSLYGGFLLLCAFAVQNRKHPLSVVSFCFLLASSLLFSYTINCGINYYRKPFSAYLGLKTGEAGEKELKELCEWLTAQVNQSRKALDADPDRYRNMNKKGVEAMEAMAGEFPSLSGFYPRPKPVAVSFILSVQQLSGIYVPFTIEANYNREMTDYNIPHTICHELSHLRGFMREDEANFIGYLACLNAPFPDYNYSGYLSGWIYAGNALAKTDFAEYLRLYESLDQAVKEDLSENSAFWDKYEGRVAETANQMNDAYLKANGQSDGVRTYGRVVDLMLADFLEKRDDSSCTGAGKMVK